MSDRMVGILGGMGPEATLDLYREIIRLTPARVDQDHIRVLIYSNPKIPDRTRAILAEGEDPLPLMIEMARVLERGGAGLLAIPCNAAHHFLPQLQSNVSVPILNMIEETCRILRLRFPQFTIVGLLAATGTVRSGIYATACLQEGLSLVVPEDSDQQQVHLSIQQIKAGTHDVTTRRTLESVGAGLLRKGARAVILGCTEIPLAFNPANVGYPCVNPTHVLAQAAVDWALGKRG